MPDFADSDHAPQSASPVTPEEAEAIRAAEEGTLRRPQNAVERWAAPTIAVAWSLYQLAIATFWTMDTMMIRSIHLGFGMLLCFLSYPALRQVGWPFARWTPGWLVRWRGTTSHRRVKWLVTWFAARDRIPWCDWLLGLLGAAAALYIVLDWQGYVSGQGIPSRRDLIVGCVLLVLLLEATRRTIGPALAIVALAFSAYAFMAPHMPAVLASKAISLSRYIGQMTRTSEGIYGVPLDVSATVVFLFVLFGAMLERAGGGRFFIDLAMRLVGGYRGGPAKAAVLSSGLTGLISGSSIANVVTTGTFTIPLMKEVGYPPEKAAAIEVAASTDGQLAPPVMGAAAFIIAEKLGLPYREVIKAAIVPAFASYVALFYITHLEACKLGLRGLPRTQLPQFFRILRGGLHFLVPLAVMLYMLIGQGRSPEMSASWAIGTMAVLMLVQHPWRALATGQPLGAALWRGVVDILAALAAGARGMVTVAMATAAAGIIVGVVNLGLGGKLSEIIIHLSHGNVLTLLAITAFGSLIIGMGLPTTATYIVMSALLAPTIVLAAETHHLIVPAMAAHLFVFYFGILADDTPPVGLASYAASAIARSDPIRTGLQAFMYHIRTAILPFFFIFNAELILDGVTRWDQGLLILAMTTLGGLAFAAGTQGWFATRNRWWELPFFLAATWILMRPDAMARSLGVPMSQRYWTGLIAVGVLAALWLGQRWRAGRAERKNDGSGAAGPGGMIGTDGGRRDLQRDG